MRRAAVCGCAQILFAIGLLEMWGEGATTLASNGEKHYMRGGKPGFFPTFDLFRETVCTRLPPRCICASHPTACTCHPCMCLPPSTPLPSLPYGRLSPHARAFPPRSLPSPLTCQVHPLPLDLWDPLGFTKKLTPEKKEKVRPSAPIHRDPSRSPQARPKPAW